MGKVMRESGCSGVVERIYARVGDMHGMEW